MLLLGLEHWLWLWFGLELGLELLGFGSAGAVVEAAAGKSWDELGLGRVGGSLGLELGFELGLGLEVEGVKVGIGIRIVKIWGWS